MKSTLEATLQFNKVYKENKTIVSRYIANKIRNKEVAEELVEDVFIKVSKNLDRFDGTISALSTWIYNITKNTLIDHFRKTLNAEGLPKYNTISIDINEGEETSKGHVEIAATDSNPLQQLISNETTSRVKDAIKGLTKLEKKLITLYALKSKSYEEIAEELDMPMGTVKGTIHRARLSLRETLQPAYA
jgi:RNA polymerase sigma-70 factor, ECF subfamily